MRKPYQQKPRYLPVGEIVWFNAYVDKNNKELQCLCRGIITRQPTDTSPIYKVIPLEIGSITQPSRVDEKMMRGILGKKIPKHGTGITKHPAEWYFNQCKFWLKIDSQEEQKIINVYRAKS